MENQNQRSNEETGNRSGRTFLGTLEKACADDCSGLFTALLAFGGSKFLMTSTYQSVTKIYI